MRLDIDCVRSVLLALESHLKYDENLIVEPIYFDDLCAFPEMKAFSKEIVLYTSQKLEEASLISFVDEYADNALWSASYHGITYDGHQFIEKIRSDDVFAKTKNVLSKVGSFSLNVVGDVASKVLAGIINQNIGIN